MTVTLLGIRHHGPGSARAVAAALAELRPDVVLIEGPPEADALVRLVADPGLVPPVAVLAYPDAEPGRAAFWPFAVFSPEWVALKYAVEHGVPAQFCDLPAAQRFAESEWVSVLEPDPGAGDSDEESVPDADAVEAVDDPIALLAGAAGYDDPERWWEDVVEQRGHRPEAGAARSALDSFAAIAEAMTAVRAEVGDSPAARRDAHREAYMRQRIRAARKAGHERIAVVCGAFHVPALAEIGPAAPDAALLRQLPKKVKTTATWVPWTHGRLALRSGYGAGVAAPGWYRHLFTAPDRVLERWFVRVAELFRAEDLPVSSAHLIEATRLADTLATLRGRALPGLSEVTDAVRSVFCDGDDTRLRLVQEHLVIGEALGEVPAGAPVAPLAADLEREMRALRLRPKPGRTELDFDLRKPLDARRSALLHRLALLGIGWGELRQARGTGTFRESWSCEWQPEFAVRLVEAAIWGSTVASAAAARATDRAEQAARPADIVAVVEACLPADLPAALGPVMSRFADRAALEPDVTRLADALPGVARTLRYGDVRGTDTASLSAVADGLLVRIALGFPAACVGLDTDGARLMRERLDRTHQAVHLLADTLPAAEQHWQQALARIADRAAMPGLLAGRAVRLRYDAGALDGPELGRRMGLALTPGVPPAEAAAWLDGVLSGGAMLLIHDPALLSLLDDWITAIPEESFLGVVPLLRRTFAGFEAPERRKLGEMLTAAGSPAASAAADPDFDHARADRALPVVALLLGDPGTDLERTARHDR